VHGNSVTVHAVESGEGDGIDGRFNKNDLEIVK
jgi:hypothetical protein